MAPERRSPQVSDGPDEDSPEHLAKPVDPFRAQLDSQPRDLARPGQSGFFKPEAKVGRYSMRDIPAEEVVVRPQLSTPIPTATRSTPAPMAPRATPTPAASEARATPARAKPERQTPTVANDAPRARLSSEVPRFDIPPTLRAAAQKWCETGNLPVGPDASSGRARALQRATLIALLQDAPSSIWPHTMQERAQWLFRDGWDDAPLELDACLTLLDLPGDDVTKLQLRRLLRARLSAN